MPLKVNQPYPKAEPLSTVPPDVLKALPVLPEDLEYRFVGKHLILYDARAGTRRRLHSQRHSIERGAIMRLRTQQSLIAAFTLALSARPSTVLEMAAINSAGEGATVSLPNARGLSAARRDWRQRHRRSNQYRLAEKLVGFRKVFPYEFVLMLGDNTYGGESAKDFEQRFERPYKPLLDCRREVLCRDRQPRHARTSGCTSRST